MYWILSTRLRYSSNTRFSWGRGSDWARGERERARWRYKMLHHHGSAVRPRPRARTASPCLHRRCAQCIRCVTENRRSRNSRCCRLGDGSRGYKRRTDGRTATRATGEAQTMRNAIMWSLVASAFLISVSEFEAAAQNLQRRRLRSRGRRQRWRDPKRGTGKRAAEGCASVDGGIDMCAYQSHNGLISREMRLHVPRLAINILIR